MLERLEAKKFSEDGVMTHVLFTYKATQGEKEYIFSIHVSAKQAEGLDILSVADALAKESEAAWLAKLGSEDKVYSVEELPEAQGKVV